MTCGEAGSEQDGRVLVLGCGTVGVAIAQLAALAGYHVVVTERDPARLKLGQRSIQERFGRLVASGRLDGPTAEAAWQRLVGAVPAAAAATEADIVVECVPEDFTTKVEALLPAVAKSPEATVMTTTSRLSITRLAASLDDGPERMIGAHFFVPATSMRLVEVTAGEQTSPTTVERTLGFLRRLGKEPVVCRKDQPGFIASRAYAALRTECVRMVEEGLADPADIDKVLRLGFNFPVGPFELADVLGLDAYLETLELLEACYGERFAPPPLLRSLVAEGRLGQKTGWGFYRHDHVVTSQTAGEDAWVQLRQPDAANGGARPILEEKESR